MTRSQRLRWAGGLALSLLLTIWGVSQGTPLAAVGLVVLAAEFIHQVWLPYLGKRTWLRLRYHADTPPDPAALQRVLAPFLRYGALILRWHYSEGRLSLWLEAPTRVQPILANLLPTVLPTIQLESVPPPPIPLSAPVYRWPLRGAGTGGAADPVDFTAQLLPTPAMLADGELRLVLFDPRHAALLLVGQPTATARGLQPVRWLPASPRLQRLRAALLRRYPWGEIWPTPDHALPLLRWPATVHPVTAGLDTHYSYQIAPTPPVPAAPGPQLVLGVSSATGEPVRMPLPSNHPHPPPIWTRHFLSLGTGPQRYGAVARLAEQALAQRTNVVVLDPAHTLIPRLGLALSLQTAHSPAWINRNHPRGSVRLNLLAIPPLPANSPLQAEVQALHLALTGALPLFDQFLARLGIAPWSTTSGDVLIHDLALLALLSHHRARLGDGAPSSPPTPYRIYQQLESLTDLRPLVAAEWQAWAGPSALPRSVLHRSPEGADLYVQICAELETALCRWDSFPPATQQEIAGRLVGLLRPILAHPGLITLWQSADTAPATYFNRRPAPLTLTHLLPPTPTGTDATLAGWYGEYLLLCLVAAAQARRYDDHPAPPMLVLLDDLASWWDSGLLAPYLPLLGQAGISCAVSGTHLPPPPDTGQVLDTFGTWWVHTLTPNDVAPVVARLDDLPQAQDLPLTHLPPHLALLRTTVPYPTIGTVYTDRPTAPEEGH